MANAAKAGALLNKVFEYAIDKVEGVIDEELKETHSAISESVEAEYPNIQKELGLPSDCLGAFRVQSGGCYSPLVQNDSEPLHYDIIVLECSSQCSGVEASVLRTFLINPTAEIKRFYNLLLDLLQVTVYALQSNSLLSQVYIKVKTALQVKDPELVKHLPATVGHCESKNISEDSQDKAQEHDVFIIEISLQGLTKPQDFRCHSENLSLTIKDTVLVTAKSPAKFLTEIPREYQEISYTLEDESAPAKRPSINLDELQNRGVVRGSRLRNKQNNQQLEHEKERKEHQLELRRRKQEELKFRFESGDAGADDAGKGQRSLTEVSAYPSVDAVPSSQGNGILVDTRHEALLLPIQGRLVPFHVSTIKNVSKNEEGKYIYLRINFLHPGVGMVKDSAFILPELKSSCTFYIKELTFRSCNSKSLHNAFRMLKELIKKVKVKDFSEHEKQDLVDQERLVLTKGRRPTLHDVTIRPNISGKKTQGTLEGHQNGIRFLSTKNEKVDLIFGNVKHAVFQPVENELIVLIHVHLHNAIIVGNKKTADIQFYAEAGIQSDDLDMRRRSGMDADEIQQEQRERKYKEKLNKEFKTFVDSVQVISGERIEFDIPYRELGFYGVPHKSNVFIMPSVNCLVSLIDQPFFVASLSEIEAVHMERVQFVLRNFDLVLIFKTYSRPPIRISTIPAEHLESIKDWLNDIDIIYSESVNPLNWSNVMKEITQNLSEFVENGGWEFLQDSDGEDDSHRPSSGDEQDSEFDEKEAGSEEDDNSEFGDSAEEEDESEDEEDSESEDEGKNWEQLEEEARLNDSKRKALKLGKEPQKKPKN